MSQTPNPTEKKKREDRSNSITFNLSESIEELTGKHNSDMFNSQSDNSDNIANEIFKKVYKQVRKEVKVKVRVKVRVKVKVKKLF